MDAKIFRKLAPTWLKVTMQQKGSALVCWAFVVYLANNSDVRQETGVKSPAQTSIFPLHFSKG
jgi:hypothetical protein